MKTPWNKPITTALLYKPSYTLILGTYLKYKEMILVLIISIQRKIWRKNQAIKSSQKKTQREISTHDYICKSKAAIPLTLETLLQLVGQLFVLIIWMNIKVCINK